MNGDKDWQSGELEVATLTMGELPDLFKSKASLCVVLRMVGPLDLGGKYCPVDAASKCGVPLSVQIYDAVYTASGWAGSGLPRWQQTLEAGLVHELTHSIQYYDTDKREALKLNRAYDNILLKDWVKEMGWRQNWIEKIAGWEPSQITGPCPTANACARGPREDMADSAALYVVDPSKLAGFQSRYSWLKLNLFGQKQYALHSPP